MIGTIFCTASRAASFLYADSTCAAENCPIALAAGMTIPAAPSGHLSAGVPWERIGGRPGFRDRSPVAHMRTQLPVPHIWAK